MWWVLGVLGAFLLGWSLFSAHHVLYPQRRVFPLQDPRPRFIQMALAGSHGALSDLWVFEALAPRGRILCYHGYSANRNQVLGIAHQLRERGYEVLVPELSGHGNRPGRYTFGAKEVDEAGVILQWAASRDGAHALPLAVVGLSMGAAIGCQVAARYPAVRAVVADSLYSRFFPVLRRAIRTRYHLSSVPWAWLTWWSVELALGRRLTPLDPAALAPHLSLPLLAIYGGADQRVIPVFWHEVYRRWAGPKEQWIEPNVAHVGMFMRDPRRYGDRIAAFLDHVLGLGLEQKPPTPHE